MITQYLGFTKKVCVMTFLFPMIPIWNNKRRISKNPDDVMLPEFVELPRNERIRSKECAICRRGNADYEHSCGVAFHKACIRQYFDAISAVDGAERICPHCYAPFPLDLDSEAKGIVEVSPIPEEIYNQYLELSDEFSLALIEGRITDVSVFLSSPSGEQYFANVNFRYYPRKPTFSFPDELLSNLDDLDGLLTQLNNWDPELPPRLVDVLLGIESKIRPKEVETEPEGTDEIIKDEKEDINLSEIPGESEAEDTGINEGKNEDIVEVFAEGDVVEVTPEKIEISGEDSREGEEILPATFFELDSFYEPKSEDSFENEEAISQYLELSNSFSVELIDDNVYHVIVHLSSLDTGIYNIYPITINFRDYPKKPSLTFTDDLLIRIRGLDEILDKLRYWDDGNPQNMVDVFQGLETKLMEDSMVESELEVIKMEFPTRRLSKNRIVVTLTSYGPRFFEVELDLKNYPSPPLIYLPEELSGLDIDELEGMRKWPEKLQKRIMDVLRSLSQAIKDLFRMEFEESLLQMVSDEFEVLENGYRVAISVLRSQDQEPSEGQERALIYLNIKIPPAYPLMHPEIEIEADDDALLDEVEILLADVLKSWTPSMFLADALNRVSLSLSNTSRFKCLICGQEDCPVCDLPLLTINLEEVEDICEAPCIKCERPYHIHCITRLINDGEAVCGYCLTDLSRLFLDVEPLKQNELED